MRIHDLMITKYLYYANTFRYSLIEAEKQLRAKKRKSDLGANLPDNAHTFFYKPLQYFS
jgi:hypothetical protein